MYRATITTQSNSEVLLDTTKQSLDSMCLAAATVQIQANGAGSFSFSMPPTHHKYAELHRLIDYVDIYRDDEADPFWTGRIYEIKDTFNGIKKVSCEGAMAYLSDSIYRPRLYSGTLRGLVESILTSHNDQVEAAKEITIGNFTVDNVQDVYRDYLNYETSISRLKDLVDSFGGYMLIRKTGGVLYLDWLKQFTTPCTQEVLLKENLLDFNSTVASDTIATVLIPLGAKDDDGNRLTIESVNGGLDYITLSSVYTTLYGYVVKTHIWDDVHDPSILLTKARTYLNAARAIIKTLKIKAVDLADTGLTVDSFRVGQRITVTSPFHGLNAAQYDCVKQKLDLLHPANNTLELGAQQVGYVESRRDNGEQLLLSVARDIERSKTVLEQMIDLVTQTITGNCGGYVVIHDSNDDGAPDEILIMDTPDINTAVKVWRWNNAGLGYSSTGYNGTYGLALTMQGVIVADFITAGTMLADRIRGGTLILGGYNNQYGVMEIKNSSGLTTQRTNKDGTTYYDDAGNILGYIESGTIQTMSPGECIYRLEGGGLLVHNNRSSYTTLYTDYGLNGYPTGNSSGESVQVSKQYGFRMSHYPGGNPDASLDNTNGLLLHNSSGTQIAAVTMAGEIHARKAYFWNSTRTTVKASIDGDGYITGARLSISGTKNRIVDTEDYGKRLLYCYETPSPLFGDVGEGTIGTDGLCYVWLDPILAETISTEQYQIFLQQYGAGTLHVKERKAGCFIVEGTPGLAFGWELKAKQQDYDQLRLETYREEPDLFTQDYAILPTNQDYGEEAADHIKTLQEARGL